MPLDYAKFLKKHKLKEGGYVSLQASSGIFEGSILPQALLERKDCLALKLKSGYNIGIAFEKIKKVERLPQPPATAKKNKIFPFNPSLPTIQILHIGGTIASKIDYRTGSVTAGFGPEDLLEMFPEVREVANFKTKKITQIASENMRIEHYSLIAKEIAQVCRDKSVKGILLPHGTDTMHYTSAALAFMLENVQVPVILVGSQRSTDRGSNDAAMNLVCASEFIAKTDFVGVGICMHESTNDDYCAILPACKTRKLHSSRRDAFKPVNDTPIARVNFETREIEFVKKDYTRKDPSKKLVVFPKMENRVAMVKAYPNMHPEQFDFILKKKYKGLVIEGTGLGQIGIEVSDKNSKPNRKIFETIKKICKSGCIAVMASQTIFGRAQMHVYTPATYLLRMGVVCGEDMTAETAFIKLSWLLGNYPKEKARELVGKNLRGEISEFTRLVG